MAGRIDTPCRETATAMLVDELDYHLPPDLIADAPTASRDAARLMVIRRSDGQVSHHHVRDLPQLLGGPTDLLVFNRSKVLPAAFEAVRTGTGGKVTGLYLNSPQACQWQVMLESRGSLRAGEAVALTDEAQLELVERLGDGCWLARLDSRLSDLALLEQIGSPPLPPYIRRARKLRHQPTVQIQDVDRYNTVYATDPGSVAAPTAGLHFTDALLAELDAVGVMRAALTLHVGLGTFAPIRTEQVEDHPIHAEHISIPSRTIDALGQARRREMRIIPIGTTSVRALEALPDKLPDGQQFTTSTDLFITPADGGFAFRFTDALMTNFHLPRSTLLALVAALPGVGIERLLGWYRQAIEQKYRFYSYGDAMLIL